MIIAPLVFATLVNGICKIIGVAILDRVDVKSLAWFIFASLMSLGVGLTFREAVSRIPVD